MRSRIENPSIPAWSCDELDSACPPEIDAPYFDPDLDAWVVSRHADLLAVFHESEMAPGHVERKALSESPDDGSRLNMRAETTDALSTARLRVWREALTAEAVSCANGLPAVGPIDLVAGHARPLCLSLAAMVTGIARGDAEKLEKSARIISAATAAPEDASLRDAATSAAAALRVYFPSGPEPMRESGLVGLSQTLPCILGSAWYALTQFPDQWTLLHRHPELIDHAIEELLRYAGPVRILFRTAMADLYLNDLLIRRGDRVILRVFAANHDPARFVDAGHLDCVRRDTAHFAFGAGDHSCVAASLIRMAAKAITQPLVMRFASVRAVTAVDWQGGSTFRYPASLWVRFDAK